MQSRTQRERKAERQRQREKREVGELIGKNRIVGEGVNKRGSWEGVNITTILYMNV